MNASTLVLNLFLAFLFSNLRLDGNSVGLKIR
jgi:hypothetical protein